MRPQSADDIVSHRTEPDVHRNRRCVGKVDPVADPAVDPDALRYRHPGEVDASRHSAAKEEWCSATVLSDTKPLTGIEEHIAEHGHADLNWITGPADAAKSPRRRLSITGPGCSGLILRQPVIASGRAASSKMRRPREPQSLRQSLS